jgi:NAD(P)H-dependent FMN reductase
MHSRIMAERQARATASLAAAADRIAKRYGLKEQAAALTNISARDPGIQALEQLEAVVVLLEAFATLEDVPNEDVPKEDKAGTSRKDAPERRRQASQAK